MNRKQIIKMNSTTDNNITKTHANSGFIAGNACILLATIFWGINVSATKALIPDWMSANGITAVRLIGGCILFWIASIFTTHRRIAGHDWLRFFLAGFIGLFGFIFLFVTSLKYGDPIDISIIMTLPPVFVILIGVLFQHRHTSLLEWLGVLVSFAGAVLVIVEAAGGSGNQGSDRLLGNLLAVASTICYAFYLVILEGPTKIYKPVTMLRWVFLFAAIPALVLVPEMAHLPILHTTEATPWIEIAFILFCPTFIAYFLVQPAIKNIGSELVSLYQYLLPVFATISAVLMGLSHLRWIQAIAMLIIVGGMIITNFGKMRKPKPAPDTDSPQKNI